MGHQNQRRTVLAVEGKEQIGNPVPGLPVQIAGGLVGEQQRGLAVKGPGERHSLLLAAGKLCRKVMKALAEPKLFEQRPGVLAALPVAFAAQQGGQLNVLQRVEGRHQHKRLKHKADVAGTQRCPHLFIQPVQRLTEQVNFATAAVVKPGEDRQQRGLPRAGLANQGDALTPFDKQLNSGKDGEFLLPLTDGLLKMMNFKYVFRWHLPFLCLILVTCRAAATDTLLVLGDSLSAGYRMAAGAAWPALLNEKWQPKTRIVNGSISGDTTRQGLARLPALLEKHHPRWVLVELGGNDGLRGFAPAQVKQTLDTIIRTVQAAGAEPLLMQIRLPANYGRRYTASFSAIYPQLAEAFSIPLLPFFMEEVYLKPQWMQDDGIHPNRDAQPFIADWVASRLAPIVKHGGE